MSEKPQEPIELGVKSIDAPSREQLLAERNELLVQERNTFAHSYDKAAEELRNVKRELIWNGTAAKAADSAKKAIIQSLDQVRAAIDQLNNRVSVLEKRFPSLMQGFNLILEELQRPRSTKKPSRSVQNPRKPSPKPLRVKRRRVDELA